MTETNLDALVNDAIFNSRAALVQLERHIAHERETLERLEADREADYRPSRLAAGSVVAMRAVAEIRLLVQMRRQAGRFVADEQHDGSDY
jgi:hypothetical protein